MRFDVDAVVAGIAAAPDPTTAAATALAGQTTALQAWLDATPAPLGPVDTTSVQALIEALEAAQPVLAAAVVAWAPAAGYEPRNFTPPCLACSARRASASSSSPMWPSASITKQ